MTLAEMRTEVFRRLDESSVSPNFWTQADVDEALNDGYEELSDASEWYERMVSLALLDHRPYYDLRTVLYGDTLLSPGRCYNVQTSRWMEPTHVRNLDYHIYRRWESIATGAPEKFYQRGLWWLGTFPQSGADSGFLRFYYTAMPTALSNASDTPGFPQEFHLAIVDYAVGDLLGQEGETKQSLLAWARYMQGEQALVAFVNGRQKEDRINALHG